MTKEKPRHNRNLEIRWKNFRGFEDTGWLPVPMLTVLIGPNNSGKSTLLAPLLLLNQTIASRDPASSLLGRGRLIDAGNYSEFVHNHDVSRNVSFGIRFHLHEPELEEADPWDYPPGGLDVTFKAREKAHDCILAEYRVEDSSRRTLMTRSRENNGKYSIPVVGEPLRPLESEVLGESTPTNFMFSPTHDLSRFQERATEPGKRKRDNRAHRDFSQSFSRYLAATGWVFSQVRSLLDQMIYVGPLRERAARVFQSSGELPSSIGAERAAQILKRADAKTLKRVNSWIERLGIANELHIESFNASDLFSLSLSCVGSGTRVNVTDAGFGVSQVLPILVQATTAAQDSLTLVEQPEAHLNPRQQVVLAELFGSMAASGRRAIVETHSEHILTALRRLIAAGEIASTDVAVYFVERTGFASRVRRVPIEANGHIDRGAWPKEFFQDGLREAIALAEAQSQKRP